MQVFLNSKRPYWDNGCETNSQGHHPKQLKERATLIMETKYRGQFLSIVLALASLSALQTFSYHQAQETKNTEDSLFQRS